MFGGRVKNFCKDIINVLENRVRKSNGKKREWYTYIKMSLELALKYDLISKVFHESTESCSICGKKFIIGDFGLFKIRNYAFIKGEDVAEEVIEKISSGEGELGLLIKEAKKNMIKIRGIKVCRDCLKKYFKHLEKDKNYGDLLLE